MQGQERVRKTSLDLRREIIDVGGIQNLIELRKKRKQKKREAQAALQEAPLEPEEITGPVDGETFLKAAVEGNMKIIEKFLADSGSPDTCDQVIFLPRHVPTSFSEMPPDFGCALSHTGIYLCP